MEKSESKLKLVEKRSGQLFYEQIRLVVDSQILEFLQLSNLYSDLDTNDKFDYRTGDL